MKPVLIHNGKLYSFKEGTKLPEKPTEENWHRLSKISNKSTLHGAYYEWLYQLESLALPIEEGSVERVKKLMPDNAFPLFNRNIKPDAGLYDIEAEFEVVNIGSDYPSCDSIEVMRLVERKEELKVDTQDANGNRIFQDKMTLEKYLLNTSDGRFTEFRLVMQPDGSGYIHALNQDCVSMFFTITRKPE